MIVSFTKIIDTVQWMITVFLLSSFLLFDSFEWGKYSFFICSALIFTLTVVKNRGRIKLRLEPFIVLFSLFVLYSALTAIWAISPSDTLTKSLTLLRILVCFTLLYWAYAYETDPTRLISVFVAASYVIAIYTVFFFGFDRIINSSDDVLLADSFSNFNSIALFLAFGVICDLYLLLFDRFRLYSIASVLSVVIIASMQTRKAIIFLIVGTLAILLMRFSYNKSVGVRILKIMMILTLVIIGVYLLSRLPVFFWVNKRLVRMINTIFGVGKTDNSSEVRFSMIELGLRIWLKRPLIGYGMANTHILCSMYLNYDTYLHDNYVELLAGGGVLAFGIFYSMYAYLIYGYFKLRKTNRAIYVFGIIMIGLLLLSDIGRVSYYTKYMLFELMMLFITLRTVTNGKKELADAVETDQVSHK